MFAYAKKWNARYAGGSPKIAVVHEGGLGENRQPLPGCRKTHDITETGVNHLRLQMQQGTVKRLDTMMYGPVHAVQCVSRYSCAPIAAGADAVT